MFGRPKIRKEKRILDFDNNLIENGKNNHKLLESLLKNCHVLRHPGIRREVESKIQFKFGGHSGKFDIKDEFWTPPSSCIQVRKTYLLKSELKDKKETQYVIHLRPQPAKQDENQRTKKEQKISAALALYHFYKPKSRDGNILSFKEFTKVFVKKSRNLNDPLEGSNWYKNGLVISLKKLTSTQLKGAAKPPEPLLQAPPQIVIVEKPVETVKTAYGRKVKPVLAPKTENNVKCQLCETLCSSMANLKQHMKKAHETLKSAPDFVPAPPPILNYPFKCDICYRRFEKRTRMIRHIKNVHSLDIHRVDLNKFVLPKKFTHLHPWSLIEL